MKPKKMTETIVVTYWQCLKPEHRHKTARVAAECIEKSERPKHHASESISHHLDAVINLRETQRLTFKRIGEIWGVSSGYASIVYRRALRHRDRKIARAALSISQESAR